LGLNASLHHFRDGYSSNVIADIPGKVSPQKYVVVGAHYDCRNTNVSSNNTRAPGANDDASGISALVELARIFKSAPISIPYTIRFAAFSGEEQGLYGSTALANEYKAAGVDVVAMVQADTIGYQSTDYLGLNFGARYTTDAFTLLLEQLANQYVPALTIGRDQGCCSDQQPFFNNGYTAAQYRQVGGAVIDPFYHNVGDILDRPRYNVDLLVLIVQAMVAGVGTVSGVQ